MNTETSGILYIVATPIGNLEDISARAIAVLSSVSLIAAEDTRHSGRLLQALGVDTRMMALHDHNERDRAQQLLSKLESGEDIALISDAGTPLISDPGFVLVREARRRGLQVSPVPGPSAIISALCAAGLPTDRFAFEGFLPAKKGGRCAILERLVSESATLVFYESPHRILDSVADIAEVMGADRELVIARELTKTFETFYSGAASEVLQSLRQDPHGSRGEFVIMVAGAVKDAADEGMEEADRLLKLLLPELPVKKVAKIVADITGKSKNDLYQRALSLKEA
ncbi:16S rRNA (cytidine(1402)-2'-O)-methyltransferase [Marinobacter sp. CHS3-4]|uniref:16S rRNA (cytidine(1402)-2'-O)-methyltransferase n=1 Tax=Marinobacter sp. CHS3-4 TaxID=3045174 RepID=UPI0024B5909A|nr:16S rRNA (cytidine(1402)-2'-O)-methyltransferase [Marinobacter sp. CHS3-4]MDI9246273.1 16S rRNA (cytidine(1402)-2'-O)-methyltransferase [Marinobacter sp. CHS3-4]